MLAIKIDNSDIENKVKEYAAQHKKAVEDVVSEAMKFFLDMHKKDDKLLFIKKDPMQHLHKIEYEDDGEDLSDVKPFSHIEDSASYIHNLRRERNK
jgi:predicted site-specific integrase-resolvase